MQGWNTGTPNDYFRLEDGEYGLWYWRGVVQRMKQFCISNNTMRLSGRAILYKALNGGFFPSCYVMWSSIVSQCPETLFGCG